MAMKIKIKVSIAGMTFSYRPGQIVDYPDDAEAKRLVAAGYAEIVESAKGTTRTLDRAKETTSAESTAPPEPPAATTPPDESADAGVQDEPDSKVDVELDDEDAQDEKAKAPKDIRLSKSAGKKKTAAKPRK